MNISIKIILKSTIKFSGWRTEKYKNVVDDYFFKNNFSKGSIVKFCAKHSKYDFLELIVKDYFQIKSESENNPPENEFLAKVI